MVADPLRKSVPKRVDTAGRNALRGRSISIACVDPLGS